MNDDLNDDLNDIDKLNKQIEQLRKNRNPNHSRHEYENEYENNVDGETTETAIEIIRERNGRSSRKDRNDRKSEKSEKAEMLFGAFSFQLMLVLILAIAYILLLTFAKPFSQDVLLLIKEKEAVDFSFRDKVYDSVGAFLTFLNQQNQSAIEPTPQQENLQQEAPLPVSSDSGVGGDFTPVVNDEVPTNCTLSAVALTGTVLFPLKCNYTVSSEFGFRNHPKTGQAEFHTAVDFACEKNETVYAIADGTVIKSEKNASLGNFILIDHGDGFSTVYGHCNSLLVQEGTTVKAGSAIAKTGSTGDSTGNHLHFGAKKDGKYFNPEYLFKQNEKRASIS